MQTVLPPFQRVCITWFIPGLVALLAGGVMVVWQSHDPATDLVVHVPGMDGEPETVTRPPETVDIGAFFEPGVAEASDHEGSWPRFRGTVGDNRSRDGIRLAEAWSTEGPPVLWTRTLGEGHGGAAIHRGRVYVLDYDETARRDVLRCLSLDDGRDIWQRGYAIEVPRNHGMSRTVPAVTDRHVVTLGPRCQVMCVDAETGDFLWGRDFVRMDGTTVPMWYAGQCPLIVDGVAILAPAGDRVLLMGIDCATGETRWETPNLHGLGMSHASIVPATIHGVRMYVYAALGGMIGVSAEPEDEGSVLWFAPEWDRSVIAPSPVVREDGLIFATAGYGGGGMLLQVIREGGTFRTEVRMTYRANQGLAAEHQTPVRVGAHLYGVVPNDAGPIRNQLICVLMDDPQTVRWTSGREFRIGLGPFLEADGKLFALSDTGVLTMFRATPDACEVLDSRVLMDGHEAWAPMALADGRLILRDSTRMLCVDLREELK